MVQEPDEVIVLAKVVLTKKIAVSDAARLTGRRLAAPMPSVPKELARKVKAVQAAALPIAERDPNADHDPIVTCNEEDQHAEDRHAARAISEERARRTTIDGVHHVPALHHAVDMETQDPMLAVRVRLDPEAEKRSGLIEADPTAQAEAAKGAIMARAIMARKGTESIHEAQKGPVRTDADDQVNDPVADLDLGAGRDRPRTDPIPRTGAVREAEALKYGPAQIVHVLA
jgi:hypothetical protein